MTESSVRGAGRARGGATDTTMLIWKVIAANPGITRAQIWGHVEHGIPEGYALRSYAAERRRMERKGCIPTVVPPAVGIIRARGYVLTLRLHHLREHRSVTWVGEGDDRKYTAAKEPYYRGNAEAIDETGTKAAEHMALADALRRVERMVAASSTAQKIGRRNTEAIALLARTLRAKGPDTTVR